MSSLAPTRRAAPRLPRRTLAACARAGRAGGALALAAAVACGSHESARASDPPAVGSGPAAARVRGAVLQPGIYRAQAWGRARNGQLSHARGELRLNTQPSTGVTGDLDAVLQLPPERAGVPGYAYKGRMAPGADTVAVSLLCDGCPVTTAYGREYAQLFYAGTFRVRALGGDRYELRQVRPEWSPDGSQLLAVDTLVRVGR